VEAQRQRLPVVGNGHVAFCVKAVGTDATHGRNVCV